MPGVAATCASFSIGLANAKLSEQKRDIRIEVEGAVNRQHSLEPSLRQALEQDQTVRLTCRIAHKAIAPYRITPGNTGGSRSAVKLPHPQRPHRQRGRRAAVLDPELGVDLLQVLVHRFGRLSRRHRPWALRKTEHPNTPLTELVEIQQQTDWHNAALEYPISEM
jgi:hypothetical protein